MTNQVFSARRFKFGLSQVAFPSSRWLASLIRLAGVAAFAVFADCSTEISEPSLRGLNVFGVKPVFLLHTEQLESPSVRTDDAFIPTFAFDLNYDDGTSDQAVGFFVTLATDSDDTVKVRLTDSQTNVARNLVFVPPPTTGASLRFAAEPRPFDAGTQTALEGSPGIYWLLDPAERSSVLVHRFAVVIPETALAPSTSLEFYNSQGDDGTPLAPARIELVRDFYYTAVLGDSVMWGNGLREADKMTTRIDELIEQQTGRKVIQQRYAQSGAKIFPEPGDSVCTLNCSGEVPTASTSIMAQVDRIQRPDLVQLVLLDGCITQVDIRTITNPSTTDDELTEITRQSCGDDMTTLLRKVRATAPRARIVVTGYFQFIGPESDVFALRLWTKLQGFESDLNDDALLDELVGQSELFRNVAHESLKTAIDTINAESGGAPMIAFADPNFGPEHALFAPDRWLWSMSPEWLLFHDVEVDLPLFPEDPIQYFRFSECFGPDTNDDLLSCLYVSVGHPNPAGAEAYTHAVADALRQLQILPAL